MAIQRPFDETQDITKRTIEVDMVDKDEKLQRKFTDMQSSVYGDEYQEYKGNKHGIGINENDLLEYHQEFQGTPL